MTDIDYTPYMRECIRLAEQWSPKKENLRVGALVISADGEVLGQGNRFPLRDGNFSHAEQRAIAEAYRRHPYQMRSATLITTFNPCTHQSESDHPFYGILANAVSRNGMEMRQTCTGLVTLASLKKVVVGRAFYETDSFVTYLRRKGVEVSLFRGPSEVIEQLEMLASK